MAPLWAQASAATPITKNKKPAVAANHEETASRNPREFFKMSSKQTLPYVILNPEAGEKLYGKVRAVMGSRPFHEGRVWCAVSSWEKPGSGTVTTRRDSSLFKTNDAAVRR
jgi:hypothetical protein